jgi:hypothetical protein
MTKLITAITIALSLSTAACGKKGGDGVGVPECDHYLDKLHACARKVGGQIGASLDRTHEMFADIWRDNAKDDAMKSELPKTCTQATEDAKKQFGQCAW